MPKLSKKPTMKPKTKWDTYHFFKVIVIVLIILYIVGIVPMFSNVVNLVFSNPLVNGVFAVIILISLYHDPTIGALLLVAFIVSYLVKPDYSTSIINKLGYGTQQVVSTSSQDAQKLIGGVGYAGQSVVSEVGQVGQKVVGATGYVGQKVLGGAGNLVGDLGGSVGQEGQQVFNTASNVVGNISSGTQQLIGGVSSGTQQLIGGVESGTQQLIGGVESGSNYLLGQPTEHFNNSNSNNVMTVSQAFQKHMNEEQKDCNVKPNMMTGCDPIVGYNSPVNCGCSGACGGNCKGLDPACLCEGVSVWKDELNAQGLNFPVGYSDNYTGSTF